MKRSLMVLFGSLMLVGQAQDSKTWRLGIQLGNANNKSHLSGGSSDANARFSKNEWGSGSLDLAARYDHNKHWMATAGIGFHTIGFGYSIAQDYSLLKPVSREQTIKTDFAVLEVPAMVFYKFEPNCKNSKWLAGVGFSQNMSGEQTLSKGWNVSDCATGRTSTDFVSSTSATKGGFYWSFRWSVAREKTFRNNSILNASVLFNVGLSQVATSTVNYSIDNKTYSHEFTNKGSFVGLKLSYYFSPLQSAKEKALKAARTGTVAK